MPAEDGKRTLRRVAARRFFLRDSRVKAKRVFAPDVPAILLRDPSQVHHIRIAAFSLRRILADLSGIQ
jgi:hypothetical protein